MNKEAVVNILKIYKHIDENTMLYLEQIKKIEDDYYTLKKEDAGSFGSRTNDISKPTERLAIKVPDFVREEIAECQSEIDKMTLLKKEITAAINVLGYNYRYIVLKFYVENKSWEYISSQIHYSASHCKNLRNIALKKLMHQFKASDLIVSYYSKK